MQENELLNLGGRCIELADEVGQSVKHIESASEDEYLHKIINFYFLVRSQQTLSSILCLCQAGYTDQALTLSRSILEMTITLKYIAKQPVQRAELFVYYDYILKRNWLEKCKEHKSKLPEIYERIREEEKDVEQNYQRVKSNYPDKYHWAGKGMTIAKMAKEKEIGEEFIYDIAYGYICDKSHNAVNCVKDIIKSIEENGDITIDIGPNKKYLGWAIGFSLASCLFIIGNFCNLFKLDSIFDNKISEIENAIRQYTKER